MVLSALTALLGPPRRALLAGLAGALLLAVPDLARQLPVREGSTLGVALLVDAVGVATAALLQVALVGLLGGEPPRRWVAGGAERLRAALRRRPAAVVAGLAAAGGVSAMLTLVPSVALLGYGQVLGPLRDPPLAHLLLAQASDVVATALTAPWFALVVVRAAPAPAGQR